MGFPDGSVVPKNQYNAGDSVQSRSLRRGDPLEEVMGTHSSIAA